MDLISNGSRSSRYTLDNVFEHTYKNLIKFQEKHCDSKMESQLKASREAYISAHQLLVESLKTSAKIDYFKKQSNYSTDIDIPLDVLSSISQHLSTLLPIPKNVLKDN